VRKRDVTHLCQLRSNDDALNDARCKGGGEGEEGFGGSRPFWLVLLSA